MGHAAATAQDTDNIPNAAKPAASAAKLAIESRLRMLHQLLCEVAMFCVSKQVWTLELLA